MQNTLISVIVPIYSVEKYLPKCLDSIIAQTYHNIEIMLIDDGSPDRCGEICDEYAARDKRIKVIHKKNAGVNEARITGFKESRGEYITFVDSDDYISPLYVERLYEPIISKKVAMSCVQWVNVRGSQHKRDKRIRNGYFDKKGIEDILKTDFLFDYKKKSTAYNLGLCCKMVKREFLEGAMETAKGLWIGEDLISNLYIAYRLPSLYILDEYLYFYVQHSSQSTRNASLETWRNQICQWERILEVDSKNFLNKQLPYRILNFLKVFVRNNIQQDVPVSTFVYNMNVALQDDVVRKYFVNYSFTSLRIVDICFISILKRENFQHLYYLLKIALPIRKICKSFKKF